jgi:predicted component of viral defense system (DUF524 family)
MESILINKETAEINLDNIAKGLVLSISKYENKGNVLFEREDAYKYNQARVQIYEGNSYDIELKFSKLNTTNNFILANNKSYIKRRIGNKSLGTLSPNYFVGTLTIPIYQKIDNEEKEVGTTQIEVRSEKTDYDSEYQIMLEDIASYCTDLLFQVDSPINQSFESDLQQLDERAVYQRFVFVKALIDSKEFDESIQKIISNPSTKWEQELQEKDIRNIKRFTSRNIRELASKPNRVKLDKNIGNLNSIPLKITSPRKIESIDTPENRFVKHAISVFLTFSEECERLLINYSNKANKDKSKLVISSEAKDARRVIEKLDNVLNQRFFQDISRPDTLKINSPVLQRRSGYREILNSWLKFDLAAKLVWEGGDDVFSGGKKNVAALYEYWLFFILLDIVKTKFNIESDIHKSLAINNLIIADKNGLGLNLISGKETSLKGIYKGFNGIGRNYNVSFSFNKTFSVSADYNEKKQGSWTIPFRPDYTLSIWPFDLSDIEAEKNESIVHIHFDSKYKVKLKGFEEVDEHFNSELKNIDDEIEDTEKKLTENKEFERQDTYNNVDVYKMHAYKDAIRRTGGAYILYPGNSKSSPPFKGFHELLPGLGAFAILPRKDRLKSPNDYPELVSFITELFNHFDDRLTQRERFTVNVSKIFKDKLNFKSNKIIPEYLDDINKEKLIPADTSILIGFYRSQIYLDWFLKNSKYNIRFGDKRYAITKEMISADFLLLYSLESTNCIFLKITGRNPEVYTKQDLLNLDYPNPTAENYLIYEILNNGVKELENLNIQNSDIENIKEVFSLNEEKNSALPFAITFEQLLFYLNKQ